ncbi:hypothetical protein C6Q13_13200 [Burkholderia gladioli]|nr:hypothetical protein C6Q13_13200 [Burkholderia gladioli]
MRARRARSLRHTDRANPGATCRFRFRARHCKQMWTSRKQMKRWVTVGARGEPAVVRAGLS